MLKDNPPALLLIDLQKGLDITSYYGGNRNNPDAEANAAKLLQRWRELGLPIYHIRHSSQHSDSPLHATHAGFAFKDEVQPHEGEPIITKNVNSAFIGTDLKDQLDRAGIQTLVIAGLTTNHCVSTTARMAGNLGYHTLLVSDATAAFDRIGIHGEHYTAALIHLTTLASLKDEFAEVKPTAEILAMM